MDTIKIINGKVVTPGGIKKGLTIIIKDGIIDAILDSKPDLANFVEIDAKGSFIGPGLVDIQINGYIGVDFADQDLTLDGIRKATKALWQNGVTSYLPTVITNSEEKLLNSFKVLATAFDDNEIGKSIPGFHLEGPYISPVAGYRGAHLEKYIKPPVWDEFVKLQEAANNGIKLITLAPESDGAIPFIRQCVENDIVVSLGHHNGSAEVINDAADAGATMATHLGNGCANTIDRHKNPLWPQLANDNIIPTIIADGAHLNVEEVQCFYKIKGVDRTILVSDALDLAGLPPGEYIRSERKILLTPEVAKFPVENCLAGAAIPISACVSNMIRFAGCSLEDAIQMASTNPAKAIQLNNIGEISQNKRADLVLFTMEDGKIVVQKTIVAGEVVYTKEK